ILTTSFLMGGGPLLWAMYKNPGANFRFSAVSILSLYPHEVVSTLMHNLWRQLLMFNYSPSNGDIRYHNILDRSQLVDDFSSIFFLLGFLYFLYHWRKRPYFLMLIGFFVALIPGFASEPYFAVPNGWRTL